MNKDCFEDNCWDVGTKLTCSEWLDNEYITILCIGKQKFFCIDDEGDEYTMSYERNWYEYVPKKTEDITVNVGTLEWALHKLRHGECVRQIQWKDRNHLFINLEGLIVDQNRLPFSINFENINATTWELYDEDS